ARVFSPRGAPTTGTRPPAVRAVARGDCPPTVQAAVPPNEESVMRRFFASHPATLSLALVAAVFVVDLCLPLGVAAAVPYTVAAHLAGDVDSSELQAALGEVAEQSRRAAEIVRSIRRTVRRTEPERGLIDLNEVVRVVVRLLDWKARRADVSVHSRPADALPP